MPKFILSFDTEDYICPSEDDMVKSLCEVLEKNGLRGSFCMVAERARVLAVRGRTDVIEALKRHEIAFHSTWHSRHPNPAEYLEKLGWDDGVAEHMRREADGIRLVRELFDVEKLFAAVPPGSSWGPQGIHAYTLLGVPIFAGSSIVLESGDPVWFVNSLQVPYNLYLDELFHKGDVEGLASAKEKHRGVTHLVTCNHPTWLAHETFVDAENFGGSKNPPPSEWSAAPRRKPEQVRVILDAFDKWCGMLAGDKGFEQSSYAELHEAYRGSAGGEILPEEAGDLARRVAGGIDWVELAGETYSPAEVFGVLNFLVAHGPKDSTPVRRLLGPVSEAPALAAGFTAKRAEVEKAAREVEASLRTRLPDSVTVAGRALSPGAYLKALAAYLLGKGDVKVEPGDESPAAAKLPIFADIRYKWACFPEEFTGENLKRLSRLQSWTYKRAVEG